METKLTNNAQFGEGVLIVQKLNIGMVHIRLSWPKLIDMNAPTVLSEASLLQQMRQAHTEQELVNLLEVTYQKVSTVSDESGWDTLSNSLLQQLNSINPLYIDDAREWNMIKLARVFIHRISTHQFTH
jgi:hypothetical protein